MKAAVLADALAAVGRAAEVPVAEPAWEEGEALIRWTEARLTDLAGQDRAWKAGAGARAPHTDAWERVDGDFRLRRTSWARDDPDVCRAYEYRNVSQLWNALFTATIRLPRLRRVGQAAVFLLFRVGARPVAVTALVEEAGALPVRSRPHGSQVGWRGLSGRTLVRAKVLLDLRAVRQGGLGGGGRWYWRPPTEAEERGLRLRG